MLNYRKPLSLIFLFFISCNLKVEDPRVVEISDIEIKGVSRSILTLNMTAHVENTNNININIENIDSEVFIKNKRVGSSKSAKPFQLKKKDVSKVDFTSRIDLSLMSELYPKLIKEDSSEILVKGIFEIDLPVKNFTVKKDTKSYINLNEIIKKEIEKSFNSGDLISVKNFKMSPANLSNPSVTFDLQIDNKYSFDYTLQDLDFDIYFNGDEKVGDWSLSEPRKILKNKKEFINIRADIATSNVISGFSTIFSRKKANVLVKGETTITIGGNSFEVPINYTHKVF